ncbi:hypothetical protein BDN70DRAFT_794918 [Pholiota conissans]|uniref:F-box domain-containing protein n=1 Tax=Pholiota conissans TaxID=109636 RepID=A0A9P6D7S0_9AGAR|nr:hypothetical protein BDN70DRAFT_794918 [Pholiota conissans]
MAKPSAGLYVGHGQRNLTSLPVEILLNILSLVHLKDVVTFPFVCQAFSSLAQNRILWIRALSAERLLRPIACPKNTELVSLALADLKHIAQRTCRLQRTWAVNHPDALQISGPIKAIVVDAEGPVDIIDQVPGTELYVFHSRATGEAFVLDANTGKTTCTLHVGFTVVDTFPGCKKGNKFYVSLLVLDDDTDCSKILILCVDCDVLSGPRLTIAFEHEFKPQFSHSTIFMTTEYVGAQEFVDAPVEPSGDNHVRIVAVNITTGRQTTITTNVPQEVRSLADTQSLNTYFSDSKHRGFTLCTINNKMFIVVDYKFTSSAFPVPHNMLPLDTNPDVPSTSTLNIRLGTPVASASWDPGENLLYEPRCMICTGDPQGGLAISLQSKVQPDLGSVALQLRFWTPVLTSSAPDDATFMIVPKWTTEIFGALQSSPDMEWILATNSSSGRMILVVVNRPNIGLKLYLVVVDPGLDRCVAHELKVLSFIDLATVSSPAIDEQRGTVSLYNEDGTLFVIPYARNLQIIA